MFTWSVPDGLPLSEQAVRGGADAVEPHESGRMRRLMGTGAGSGATETARRSGRYIGHLRGEVSPPRRV